MNYFSIAALMIGLTSASSYKMTTHDMEVMINGYVDGLLDVQMERQET